MYFIGSVIHSCIYRMVFLYIYKNTGLYIQECITEPIKRPASNLAKTLGRTPLAYGPQIHPNFVVVIVLCPNYMVPI